MIFVSRGITVKGKGNGEVRPITGRESPEGEQRNSSTLSLTSALDGGVWSTPRPGRFTNPPPGKIRHPLYRRLGGHQSQYGQVRKISPPTGIRSPDRPSLRQSLYRQRYPAHAFLSNPCLKPTDMITVCQIYCVCCSVITKDVMGTLQRIFRHLCACLNPAQKEVGWKHHLSTGAETR